jgi:hypothetical protein
MSSSIGQAVAARLSLQSAGGMSGIGGMIHTLNLRDSVIKREKAANIRINEQQKKRSNMRELLVQNFLKKYNHKLDPS